MVGTRRLLPGKRQAIFGKVFAHVELYNLKNNPHKTNNLAQQQGAWAKEMLEKINPWWPADRMLANQE